MTQDTTITPPKPKDWKVYNHYELEKFIRRTRPQEDSQLFEDFPAYFEVSNDSIYRIWNDGEEKYNIPKKDGQRYVDLVNYIFDSLGIDRGESLKVYISW